jgi:SAM-dependent methyltransferase
MMIEELFDYLKGNYPSYYLNVSKNYENNKLLFVEIATSMLEWARKLIGDDYIEKLAKSYVFFVNNVNKNQLKYEKSGSYENKSYQEVYKKTYDNTEFMKKYHWGVYSTTFLWEHHLMIYKYFKNQFLELIYHDNEELVDFGSGSGIWSLLSYKNKPYINTFGIDISQTSVNLSKKLAELNQFNNCKFTIQDALTYKHYKKTNFAISCFLLEHLEYPKKLVRNIYNNLIEGGHLFITTALTAAEIDHIYEFRKESQVISLLEEQGFRVKSMISYGPKNYPKNRFYQPRSIALICQKKQNELW